jgi:signal transduction histidine kinase
VSHEIQSPLTSISGFAELLRNKALSEEKRLHYLDIIQTESARLSKMSENLLKLSALESETMPLKADVFLLDRQIQNAVLALEPQWAAKNIEISFKGDRTEVTGDEALLSQVWLNVIHNAVKFTPENGEIKISLTKKANAAVCKIADNGPGISKDDQIHIFERFYKSDKSRDRALGGNGLGLSLVKKIIELHGGSVAAESEVGKGTVFTVTLPKTYGNFNASLLQRN